MTTILSCGHKANDLDEGEYLSLKYYAPDGHRGLLYGSYCQACATLHRSYNEVLEDDSEVTNWLTHSDNS